MEDQEATRADHRCRFCDRGAHRTPDAAPMKPLLLRLFAMFLTVHPIFATAQSSAPLSLAQTVSLPDVRGRIDHLAVDVDAERLFVAALGNDSVEVIDLRNARRSQRLEALQEPQGVAF